MYAIAGVTGNTGKIVAETLLAAGKKVRVIVRDAARGESFAAAGAEVAVADLGDAVALGNALDGVEAAYLLIPPNMGAPDFYAYQLEVGSAIAQAVRSARVPHVVLLSSIGAELEGGTGPIAGLHPLENSLSTIASEHGFSVTLIRAGYFVENIASSLGALAHGVLPTFFPADLPIDMTTTHDIGRVAASVLLEGGVGRQVIELGGPALSLEQIADSIGEVTGKRPLVVVSPVESMAVTLQSYGLPASIAGLYQEMTQAITAGTIRYHGEGRRLQRQVSIAEVLRGLLA